jgi:hypothetical protein
MVREPLPSMGPWGYGRGLFKASQVCFVHPEGHEQGPACRAEFRPPLLESFLAVLSIKIQYARYLSVLPS